MEKVLSQKMKMEILEINIDIANIVKKAELQRIVNEKYYQEKNSKTAI